MIRENNQAAGKTWVWTYNGAGNILTETEYVYTTGTLGTPQAVRNYGYGDANWGDLLRTYNGKSISYDAIGNPLNDGTWTYTWQEGRKLATMSKGGTTWTFTYDANGMRSKRTAGSTVYNYTYHGSQLTHMTYGVVELHFYYDASGKPLSFTYSDATNTNVTYYYVLNLQGDVVAILDSTGNQVVGYTYDAWGRLIKTTGSKASTLGQYNPLRYRGYVYDWETGLYYVSSRYYNPEIGRWINADNGIYLERDGAPISFNLFVYCGNNPVNKYDPSGHFAISALIIGTIIGAAIGFGGTVLADYADDGQVFNGSIDAGDYVANTLVSGLIGGLTGGVASSSFTFTYPTLQFAQMACANGMIFGTSVGTASATISGTSVVSALGLIGITVMGMRIGKSGGYRIDHHYPNDHDPTHVHISGDDGTTRVDINGNPIQGDRPMTPGEKKAFWRLIEEIAEALKPWME